MWKQEGDTYVFAQDLVGHTGNVRSVVWNGQLLLSVGDQEFKVWRKDNNEFVNVANLEVHQNKINTIAYSPSRDLIFTGGNNGELKVWEHSGDFYVIKENLEGHKQDV